MTASAPSFDVLIAATTTSAVHLEMRDTYTPSDPAFRAWLAGTPIHSVLETPEHDWWSKLVRTHVQRGIVFRRARIVSEPLAHYIRHEYESTPILNIPAGEQ